MVGTDTKIGPNSDFTTQGEVSVESADTLMAIAPTPEEIAAWQQNAVELGSISFARTRSRVCRALVALATGGRDMESPVAISPERQLLEAQGII